MSRPPAVQDVDPAAVVAAARGAGGRRVALVGIDGPSASGKSTLAGRLAGAAGAPVVEVDDFWTWGDDDAWWAYFVSAVLVPLAAGRAARYRLRDWGVDRPGQPSGPWARTPAAPVVVVEGVTCTRRCVQHLYAYRIWVDADAALRVERGLRRDGPEHRELWQQWVRTETQFFAADGTPSRADLVVALEPPAPA